jgi:16S rRNA (guanine527-N7)-methyltransferase
MDPEASGAPPPAISAALRRELGSSQELGLIGPASLDDHVRHAFGYHAAIGTTPVAVADLGSGGGLPALVLADLWPECHFTLIDARERAIARLDVMVARLGWHDRVTPWLGPAETAGHAADLRGHFDVVTARGFGPPAMTAECGAPLLRLGGTLVVSEPPTGAGRWPDSAIEILGLRHTDRPSGPYVVMEAVVPCPLRFPRRRGLPRNAPLW